jgi:hypothetical protein
VAVAEGKGLDVCCPAAADTEERDAEDSEAKDTEDAEAADIEESDAATDEADAANTEDSDADSAAADDDAAAAIELLYRSGASAKSFAAAESYVPCVCLPISILFTGTNATYAPRW